MRIGYGNEYVGDCKPAWKRERGCADETLNEEIRDVDYKPAPIDTSKVKLTKEVRELTELLAKNAHEIWAQQRLSEGWRYGTRRNDIRKEHPCLVPYEELPESEKAYDRRAVTETLKAMLALGYRIGKT